MPLYVGIDLGTTNSAICTFDGEVPRIWKSPEQNDVTPSAIYNDGRRKFVGKRAYDLAPAARDSTARLFKRLMGTQTPIRIKGSPEPLSPVECSAEVLRTLFGYLPEEIRSEVVGSVITVPAAFNQMQKNATLEAAELAGIGAVALMQEPVAAVMSVMRARGTDGVFLVFDLGGGTLDVAVAETTSGRVNLLGHGGIEMCGGRDWDKAIVDNLVRPWLTNQFSLPENFRSDQRFRNLIALAEWSAEKAKIEVSQTGESVVSLTETEVRLKDLAGEEIYLEVPISAAALDGLIQDQMNQSVQAVRETLERAHLGPNDINRVVFVGGPTQYKTVRDSVCQSLAIAGAMDVNPMTAVAEGAAIFAESIDWSSAKKTRKASRGSLKATEFDVTLNYHARTPSGTSRLAIKVNGSIPEAAEFQVDSQETGWSSGRLPLRDGITVDLTLSKLGENVFKVGIFGADGAPVALKDDRVIITRTAATIEAIPASHSVGVEVLDRLGGRPELDWLVTKGDPLPKKGQKSFRAGETLKVGSSHSLLFKLWEGEITSPPSDNRYVGALKIAGSDLEHGVIPQGAELICDYEVSDAGVITIEVSVSEVGASFGKGHNFYSREVGERNFETAVATISEESDRLAHRIEGWEDRVNDPALDEARRLVEEASSLHATETSSEDAKKAMDGLLRAKKLLADTRSRHQATIREADLESCVKFFDEVCRKAARESEAAQFDNAARTARRLVAQDSSDFEQILDRMRTINFEVLWRQDWYVVQRFQALVKSPGLVTDTAQFAELVESGSRALKEDDIDALRNVVAQIYQIRVGTSDDDDMASGVNILRG